MNDGNYALRVREGEPLRLDGTPKNRTCGMHRAQADGLTECLGDEMG
ncbi:MAG TPA: hypothetical protein VLH79_11265 [Chthonomonadales bacterium]|nr:hypothetical protein [Chthonomonadales bacterium]